jgi:multiple sugar transport system substrate-binding protein
VFASREMRRATEARASVPGKVHIMSFKPSRISQQTSRMAHVRSDRRRLLASGAGLGLSLSAVGGLHASSLAASPGVAGRHDARLQDDSAVLELFHDKANWNDFYVEMGELSAGAGGASIEGVPFSDTTSYQQAILSALPTQDVPDIFSWWSGYRMEDLVNEGVLLDLTSIWDTAVQEGNLPETLAGAFTFDGAQYAAPNHVSYWPVFYNRVVFDENGISVPETWDDLMGAAETLKGAGVTPFYATIDGRWPAFIWFEEMLIRTDPDFYEALMRGEQSYTDPTVVEAMEAWKSMFDNEYFTALDIPMDADNAGAAFANGELAMIPVGTWFNQAILDTGLEAGEEYGTFILPNVNPDLDENVVIFEAGPFCVPANVANPEAVTEFLTWWVTPEAQTEWSARLKDVPANPQAETENPVLAELVSTIDEQGYRLIQRYWEATPPAIVENAVDELARFMLDPDSYEDVLATIEEIAQREWSGREA